MQNAHTPTVATRESVCTALNDTLTLLIDVLALATVPVLYVAFFPPVWLRRIWRQREEDHDRERPQGQGQVAVPAVGLVRPGGDSSDGQDRERDLDGKLEYQEDLGHFRQDSLHEDISTTLGLSSVTAWRQNASADQYQ